MHRASAGNGPSDDNSCDPFTTSLRLAILLLEHIK
jgi:hypothetical protein